MALLTVGLVACGGSSDGDSLKKATLVLDYLPNGVHAGIYAAKAKGYYEDEGIDLKVVSPTSTADTLRLIEAGKADFGLADGIDIATQIDAGRSTRGIMAITQRPAGGLITLAADGIRSPKDLDGRTVGVTGVPSDGAVYETIVRDAGGDPSSSKVITIGFNGVQALRAHRIAAFTGYIPADATAITQAGQPTRSFPLDRFGGPSYPGLVAFTTQPKIKEESGLVEGFVRATNRGYDAAIADPEDAVADLADANDGISQDLALATLKAYEPLIGPIEGFGHFHSGDIRDLSDFLVSNKLIGKPISPDRFATDEFVTADSP